MNAQRIVWPAPGRVEVEEFQLPEPAAQEVLIRMDCTVISPGTELAWLLAKPNTSASFPQYPGYSGCGHILAAGSDVKALQVGDRVIVDHCGHSSHVVCSQNGWRGQGITKIEDPEIPSEVAAFIIIATMSLQGVRKARIELGEPVAVTGLGLLGLFALQFAHLSGALPTVAVDPDPGRRDLARQLGADQAFAPDELDFQATGGRLAGRGGFAAVVESSGAEAAVRQAILMAANLGRVVLLGCTRGMNSDLNLYEHVHKKGVSIIGGHNHVRPIHESTPGYWTTRDDVEAILSLLSAQRLLVKPMISETIKPAAAADMYRRLQEPGHGLVGVVFDWR